MAIVPGEGQVTDEYPELHHYTDLNGLSGILESGTLWATRYDCLNDAKEIRQLADPLKRELAELVKKGLGSKIVGDPKLAAGIWKHGGLQAVADHDAAAYVDILYQLTFGEAEGLTQAFITSFCGHDERQEYEAEHGLLSQWRAYGGGGRVAIVFDTAGLVDLIHQENAAYEFPVGAFFGNAVYDVGLGVKEVFGPFLDEVYGAWEAIVAKDAAVTGRLHPTFATACARFKHRGFREEQEIRIAVFPLLERVLARVRPEALSDAKSKGILKNTFHRPGMNGRDVEYIRLFDKPRSEAALPIRRVIVGPGPDQHGRFEKVREIVPAGVPVVRSETPYVG